MKRLILALMVLACSAEAQQQASGATLFQGYTGTSFTSLNVNQPGGAGGNTGATITYANNGGGGGRRDGTAAAAGGAGGATR